MVTPGEGKTHYHLVTLNQSTCIVYTERGERVKEKRGKKGKRGNCEGLEENWGKGWMGMRD